jgi:nicotinamidase-related amidase
LRSRGIDTIILGGINTNVFVDTTAREAAVHEFRDSGRAARGACRRPGTGMARPPV